MSQDDLLQKYNLKLEPSQVEIGKTYPLYGMITNIINETFEDFTIEVNYQIILKCFVKDANSVNIIKERAFEPGIFVTEITSTEPVSGNCGTIVFGKKHHNEMV